jgi:hypothetical protein
MTARRAGAPIFSAGINIPRSATQRSSSDVGVSCATATPAPDKNAKAKIANAAL